MPEMGKGLAGYQGWITGREGWKGWGGGWGQDAETVAAAQALQLPVPMPVPQPPVTFWSKIDWNEILGGAVSGVIVSVTVALLSPFVIAALRRRNGKGSRRR
jgi:hypothetical protein